MALGCRVGRNAESRTRLGIARLKTGYLSRPSGRRSPVAASSESRERFFSALSFTVGMIPSTVSAYNFYCLWRLFTVTAPFWNSTVFLRRIILITCLVLMLGCSKSEPGPAERVDPASASSASPQKVLRLATTTSTRDSGLLDTLLPPFSRANNVRIDVVAVGTGAALKLGERGDADAVIVHARNAEKAFMAAEHGVRHEAFMVNYFTLLGPAGDPAGVRNMPPAEALTKIAAGGFRYLSRGDESGTHKREIQLWYQVGNRPIWDGYFESGQGMGRTLVMADEQQAYVLTDGGTYLKFREKIDLVPMLPDTEALANPYAILVVDPAKHERIREPLAQKLADYLISPAAQRIIGAYRIAGEPLFQPTRLDAVKSE